MAIRIMVVFTTLCWCALGATVGYAITGPKPAPAVVTTVTPPGHYTVTGKVLL